MALRLIAQWIQQFVGSGFGLLGRLVIAMGDSRLDWWRPRVVTREVGVVQSVKLIDISDFTS